MLTIMAGQERRDISEIVINQNLVDALKGRISEPIQTISHKPGSMGELVTVSIALEGPGMFGLTDWRDNREWAGIANHNFLTGRYATRLSLAMAEAGYNTNPQLVANTMSTVSHAGRRRWDEANWYPDIVPDPEIQRFSNETLGLRLIDGKVPADVFTLITALAHNVEGFSVDSSVYASWDYRLAVYVDHRTTQRYEPLHTRMGDFLLGNFFDRSAVSAEMRTHVYMTIADIIERQKQYRFDVQGAKAVSVEEADRIAASLGAKSDSPRLERKQLMQLILEDADTESTLILTGIDPDEEVPLPKWEEKLRYAYVATAKEDISRDVYGKIRAFHQWIITDGVRDLRIFEKLNADFPESTWWGRYARRVFYNWHETHLEPDNVRGSLSYEEADNVLTQHFEKPH